MENEEIDLRKLIIYYLAKIKYIIIFILIFMTIGNLYTYIIKEPLYEATSTLGLATHERAITQNDIILYNNLVNSYKELLASKKLGRIVASNLKLKKSNDASNYVSINAIENTQIIKAIVRTTDKNLSKRLADNYALVFIEENKDMYGLSNIEVIDNANKPKYPCNISFIKDNIKYFSVSVLLILFIYFLRFYFKDNLKIEKEVKREKEKLSKKKKNIQKKIYRNKKS